MLLALVTLESFRVALTARAGSFALAAQAADGEIHKLDRTASPTAPTFEQEWQKSESTLQGSSQVKSSKLPQLQFPTDTSSGSPKQQADAPKSFHYDAALHFEGMV